MNRVQYIDVGPRLEIGQSAHVLPLDHPSPLVSNRGWAVTSPVTSIAPGANGPTFTTENTEYRPVDEHDDAPHGMTKIKSLLDSTPKLEAFKHV